jgi:hypothetical protein
MKSMAAPQFRQFMGSEGSDFSGSTLQQTRYLLSVSDGRQGMVFRRHRSWPFDLTLAVLMTIPVCAHATSQPRAFDAKELAEYRLTLPVFERFVDASDQIAAVTRGDQRFVEQPLFTREVSVLGDATVMARELETRLSNDSALAEALRAAGLSAREYTTFALTLFGARLAHGFMSSGALRSVPKGVATDNVQFVAEHISAVIKVLQVLGVEEPPPKEPGGS